MTASPAAHPVISLSHATLRYEQGICALDDISLDIADGEWVCVLGANGSGKSTLASVLCGLLAPDEGSVSLVGERVLSSSGIDFEAYRRARRQIGLVFQNPDDQLVTSIVEEDVAFGPENLGVPADEIGPRVRRELHRVGLDRYAQADPTNLSGGQKQRVAIAGALAMEPRVLVLDEPGALLDVRGRRGIMRVMGELHGSGTTIVHITHFMDEALAADRVVVLDHGRLVLQGTPHEVFSHADQLMALGLEEPFVARLSDALRKRRLGLPWTCSEQELQHALFELGHTDSAYATPAKLPTAPLQNPPIVQATSLSFTYGDTDAREADHAALSDVSFSVPRGASVAIVGQTGSGKSTLLRMLCALEQPDTGTLVIDGIDTSNRRKRRQLHGRVGYVMQHPERQLFAETVLEDVAYGPTNMGLSKQEVDKRCREALALVGLTGREQASPFHLSGGQQRLCALAGILAMEPHILVLDEPTAGLDPHGRTQLRTIIERINAQGTTIIQVTHSMDDAATADQVIVLSEGKLLMRGTPREVFSRESAASLRSHGLGLPDALRLSLQLEDQGCPSLGHPLTLAELADAIESSGAATSPEVNHGL